jgi:transposase-like protein
MTKQLPTTLMEAIRYFSDEQVCIDFVASLRWPDGPVCAACGSQRHSYLATRKVWKCLDCKKQFSVKKGTIFEDSPIKLDKWLCAIWLIANAKNGISSYELGRSIGITQKSAWFVLHRIRLAMQTGSFDKFDGTVEVDETFIGGKARNMHKQDRKRRVTGRGAEHMTMVVGMVERSDDGPSQVRATTALTRSGPDLKGYVRDNVTEGSHVYTDDFGGYSGLDGDYDHQTVNHAEYYVSGQVHSNSIENFWALLKRGLHGTYISVEPFHLFRFIDERVFTFNHRSADDLGRFTTVLEAVSGRRLTWDGLTGKD